MSSTLTIVDICTVGLGSAGMFALIDSVPPEAQGWTVLGLLAVVVVGIGGMLVKKVETSGKETAAAIEKSGERTADAMDRNTEAQGRTATSLALLVQESDRAREEGATARAEILARLAVIEHNHKAQR